MAANPEELQKLVRSILQRSSSRRQSRAPSRTISRAPSRASVRALSRSSSRAPSPVDTSPEKQSPIAGPKYFDYEGPSKAFQIE